MGELIATEFSGDLAEYLQTPASTGELFWLGQAGFLLRVRGLRLLVDPYLSDSLAEKYKGAARPHIRMMPPPITVNDLGEVDLVLSTHAHTDHMDPGTLRPLFAACPRARFVAPRAVRAQALERSGLGADRLITMDAGEIIEPLPGVRVTASRAAHEGLDLDAEGHHNFLGYVIDIGTLRLWHSGDCIPFDGLVPEVRALAPQIALLPVNGRRPELSNNGVPGNFTLDEATEIAADIGVSTMIAHHYGLFDFNTEDPAAIDAAIPRVKPLKLLRACTGVCYRWQA